MFESGVCNLLVLVVLGKLINLTKSHFSDVQIGDKSAYSGPGT